MTVAEHPIPDEALNSHIGILGKVGSGKTYTAKGLVERLLHLNRHVVIIDPTGAWYGLRTGFEIPIFGGRNGDVEIGDKAGEAVAAVIVEQRTSAIIDLSLMTGGGQQRFMRTFAHRLRQKPLGALYLVIDEADEFLPQNVPSDQTNAYGDLKWMVRRGRLSGFRVMMITQRPAEIAKAVLTQIETLIAHRLTAPQDRKAIEEWVKGHHDPAEAKEVLSSLASLEKGTAWVWAPDLHILKRTAMPAIETFDSSRTPEPGEQEVAPPRLEALDLSVIREALAVAEEPVAAAKNIPGNIPTWPDQRAEVARLEREKARVEAAFAAARAHIAKLRPIFEQAVRELDIDFGGYEAIPIPAPSGGDPAPLPRREERAAPQKAPRPSGAAPGGDASLTGPQRQFLHSIAWWAAHGHPTPTRAQVAAIAGWRITSGHLKNVAGSLRTAGMIDYPEPGHFALTEAGVAAAPEVDRSLSFHDSLRSTLTTPQRTVFDFLLRQDGPVTRDFLARACNWEPTSGHVKNVLGSMRTLELIDYPRPGQVDFQPWVRAA